MDQLENVLAFLRSPANLLATPNRWHFRFVLDVTFLFLSLPLSPTCDHNAGVMYFTNMKNLHEDEWERTVDVNCKGTMFGVGAVLGGMVERGSGHIVNISSDAGRRIFPSLTVYCASKFFVETMSEGLRRELVGSGVKVTTIQPGDCATDLVMNNTDKEAAEEQGVSIGVKVGTGSTENQVLQPKDVAAAVLYAVTAPSHVAINEVLVEPRDQA